jgi:hypothetical protein
MVPLIGHAPRRGLTTSAVHVGTVGSRGWKDGLGDSWQRLVVSRMRDANARDHTARYLQGWQAAE